MVLTFLDLFNGWGFASSLVRDETTDKHKIGQAFGMLILMNGALAALQFAAAPLRRAYFHQPMVADLLRVQALFFLANPFIALGHALLVRRLDFKRQSRIDSIAAVLSARHRARLRLCRPRRLDPGRGAGGALVRARGRLYGRRPALADPAALPLRGRRHDAALRHRDGRGAGLLVRAEPGRRLHRRPPARCRTRSASTPPPCS